mgnify:CR=1 FL=1
MRSWFSPDPSPPPHLAVTVDQRHLQRFLTPLTAVDGPTQLTIADDQLLATTVGDAMVTAVETTLHKSLCAEYSVTPGTLGFDPGVFTEVLATERRPDAPARLTADPDAATLTLEVPSFVQTQPVDTETTVELPDIADPAAGATTYHEAEELAHAVDYFADQSAVVALGYDTGDEAFYLEAVSAASATAPVDTRYRRPQADLAGPVTPAAARSAFPVAELAALLDVVPPETVVRADYAETFPATLTWDLSGGDGITDGTLTPVTALVAPREIDAEPPETA